MTETPDRPLLRIVRGDPGPEEIAVLTAVLASAGGGGEPARESRLDAWSDFGRRLGVTMRPGSHGWASSGLPR